MTKLNHDPINCLIMAFYELYPNDDTIIVIVDSNTKKWKKHFFKKFLCFLWFRKCWAFFDSYDPRYVFIDANVKYLKVIELIAHELAHKITYNSGEKSHGQQWQTVYKMIYYAYNKKASEKLNL